MDELTAEQVNALGELLNEPPSIDGLEPIPFAYIALPGFSDYTYRRLIETRKKVIAELRHA